jgi:hypothetical protein
MSAAKHLLLQVLPAAASAATPEQQLLQQLLQCVVCELHEEQSLMVAEVLQMLQHLPLPSEEHHFSLLAAAYRDGERWDGSECVAVLCCLLVPVWRLYHSTSQWQCSQLQLRTSDASQVRDSSPVLCLCTKWRGGASKPHCILKRSSEDMVHSGRLLLRDAA